MCNKAEALTDEELIRALRCCVAAGECRHCPLSEAEDDGDRSTIGKEA